MLRVKYGFWLNVLIMRGAITPLPQYVFMAWCLVKKRDNFAFTLYIIALMMGKEMFSDTSVTSKCVTQLIA
jgi:hypothetical protein